jgi:capsular exopolysaccharide synthesis family protein
LFIITPFAALTMLSEKPIYSAKARVLIEKNTPQVLAIQDVVRNDPSEDFYQTEFSLIKSRENLEEVVNILQLDKKPPVEASFFQRFTSVIITWPKKAIRQIKSQVMMIAAGGEATNETSVIVDPAELRRMEAVNALQLATQVVPIEGTRLVDVSITGEDPREVAQQVNTLLEVYVWKNLEKRLETSRKAINWLTNKTADLKEKMQASDRALQDFREKKNLVSVDFEGKRNIIQERLISLYNAYAQANTARIDFEIRFNKVKSLSVDNLENIENLSLIGDPSIVRGLRQSYLDLLTQYRNTAETFTSKHPRMVQLQAQIDETKRALNQELQKAMNAMQTEYNILRSRESTLARELNTQKDSTLGLNNDMAVYATLQRDADNQRNLYADTAKRLEEIKLTQASIINNVQIVENATVPLLPMSSKGMLIFVGSVFAGGMFGIGLAFIKEYFANRFRNADEIEQYLRIPFLGIIPHYGMSKRYGNLPISLREPMSAPAEAYRLLRTRIYPDLLGMKTLLITSAVPSEGKTTTAANLGVTLAQLGLKVLLVDTDLRRPALHRQFQLKKERGLTTVLAQEAEWENVVSETLMPNLKVLPSGPLPYNPSDLLCLGSLRQLFEELKRSFDLILVDAPLALSLPDVEILAPDMDGVLLVHDPKQSDKKRVLESRRRLDHMHSNILGIVLNNIESGNQQYYYHSYYSGYHINAPTNHQIGRHLEMIETAKKITRMPTKANIAVNNQNVNMIIHNFQIQKEVNGRVSFDDLVFLILDLEIFNKLDAPYYFCPESTKLYVEKPENYGRSLSKILGESHQGIETDSMYKYSEITEALDNGLIQERIIPPQEKIRGEIAFQVPEKVYNFILTHENEYIAISISPINTK